jgi:hypothetical protein
VYGLIALLSFGLAAPILGFPVWNAILYGLVHVLWGLIFTDYKYAKSSLAYAVFGICYFVVWAIAYSSLGILAIVAAGAVAITMVITSRITVAGFIERGNNPNVIRPVDHMIFSLKAIHPRSGPIVGGIFGIAYVLAYIMFEGGTITSSDAILAMCIACIAGIISTAGIYGITSGENPQRTHPNEGTFNTLRNATRLTIFFAFLLTGVLIPGLMIITSIRPAIGVASLLSPIVWSYFVLFSGGYAVIQHVQLRYLLRRDNSIPTNMAQFLDYVASMVLMRKVGGGYIFIHRYLLEYFADLETDSSSNN